MIYDSVVLIDGKQASAVLVEGYERGRLEPALCAQRYRPSVPNRIWRKARSPQRIGHLAFLSSNI